MSSNTPKQPPSSVDPKLDAAAEMAIEFDEIDTGLNRIEIAHAYDPGSIQLRLRPPRHPDSAVSIPRKLLPALAQALLAYAPPAHGATGLH